MFVVLRVRKVVASGAVAERTCAPTAEGATGQDAFEIIDAKGAVLL